MLSVLLVLEYKQFHLAARLKSVTRFRQLAKNPQGCEASPEDAASKLYNVFKMAHEESVSFSNELKTQCFGAE